MIRKAQIQEVPEIWRMLHDFADQDVLPRSMGDLYSQVREYFVYRQDHGPVIGVAALHIFWEDVGEIRSVAVLTDFQRTGHRHPPGEKMHCGSGLHRTEKSFRPHDSPGVF